MKKIAIIGTNGIPSNYGGFETLVEYLADYLPAKYSVTVVCSSKSLDSSILNYKNCQLEYIRLKANGWQSIFFDIVSIFKTYQRFDKIIVLGCSGSIIMPFFYRYKSKFIMNLGGLDWKRSKWNFLTRKFLKFSEALAVKFSGFLISDNQGIKEYLLKEYKRDSFLIAYGGDQAIKVTPNSSDFNNYPFLKTNYAFSVARIQPDNNINLLLDSFDETSLYPFVLVGNWNHSPYGKATKNKYINQPNIIILDAIYDQRILNVLRSNCKIYLHGHSAGGTNPALVEAMNLSLPILAYDCVYNRYTTHSKASYFTNAYELKKMINLLSDECLDENRKNMYSLAKEFYQWEKIANLYSEVIDQ